MQVSGPHVRALCFVTSACLLGCSLGSLREPTMSPSRSVSHSPARVLPRPRIQVHGFTEVVAGGYLVGVRIHNRTQRAFILGQRSGMYALQPLGAVELELMIDASNAWEELASERLAEDQRDESMSGVLLRPGESVRLGQWVARDEKAVALEGTFGLHVTAVADPAHEMMRYFRFRSPIPAVEVNQLPEERAPSLPTVEGEYVLEADGRAAVGVRLHNTSETAMVLPASESLFVRSISFPDGSITVSSRTYLCSYAVPPSMCAVLSGVVLLAGEHVTVLDDTRICDEDSREDVEVTYRLGAVSLPCQGDGWLRGEFTADVQALE